MTRRRDWQAVAPYWQAVSWATLGVPDSAIARLEVAKMTRKNVLRADPLWAALRGNPRFEALLWNKGSR